MDDGQNEFCGDSAGGILFPNIHGLNIFPGDKKMLGVLANAGNGMNWKKWKDAKHINVVFIRPADHPDAEALRDVAECICEGFGSLGYSVELNDNKFAKDGLNFIIGWHLLEGSDLDNISANSIIYNLEPLGQRNNFLIKQLVELSKLCDVWDYSQRNIDILMSSGIAKIPRLLKIGTSKSMNRIAKPITHTHTHTHTQDIDVLFYGTMNERRADVLAQLKKAGLNVVHLFGVYGEERDSYIARSKIVLNMHFYLTYIFEIVRVSYLMTNRKAVVAECNDNTEIDDDLLSGIKAVNYNNLVPACLGLLRDENARAALEENAQKTINARRQEDAIFDALLPCNPSVSIIVPTQNRPEFLARALNSIASQTYKDYEVIVAQDGGESVAGVISSARSKGLPVRLIVSTEPKGPSHARNLGIKASRGRWIAYLDDDDVYYPDHLQTLVEALEQSNAKIAYTNSYYVIEALEDQQWTVKSRKLAMSVDFKDGIFLYGNITPNLNVMHARSCWEIAGEIDESLIVHEDWEYWIRLSQCWDFLHIDKITAEARYRSTRDDNSTFNRSKSFSVTRNAILKNYSFKKPKEAILIYADESIEWKDFLTAFLLSFMPHRQVVLIVAKNSASLNSISDEDIKKHIKTITERADFDRFSHIWIYDNSLDALQALTQFEAIYPVVNRGFLDCTNETPKRFCKALKKFTNYFNNKSNNNAKTTISNVSQPQNLSKRDSLAVLIPVYKPEIDGLELFSLQYSLNVLKPGREIFLVCPRWLDYGFYSNLFPNVQFVVFDDYFFQSVSNYSQLLMSEFFYRCFKKYEFILISQTDAILLRDELDDWCGRGFDYIGAPWPNPLSIVVNTDRYKDQGKRVLCPVGNGGLSLRRVDKCIQLINEFPEASTKFIGNRINEDLFFGIFGALSENFSIPDKITASCFSMEISPEYFSFLNSGKTPMGGHAWWRYNVDFWLGLLGPAADSIRDKAIRQHAIEAEKMKLLDEQMQKANQQPSL